jgi:hypothetical protein
MPSPENTAGTSGFADNAIPLQLHVGGKEDNEEKGEQPKFCQGQARTLQRGIGWMLVSISIMTHLRRRAAFLCLKPQSPAATFLHTIEGGKACHGKIFQSETNHVNRNILSTPVSPIRTASRRHKLSRRHDAKVAPASLLVPRRRGSASEADQQDA